MIGAAMERDCRLRECSGGDWRGTTQAWSPAHEARVVALIAAYAPFVPHRAAYKAAAHKSRGVPRKGRAVMAGGRRFQSIGEAAAAAKLNRKSIYARIVKGKRGYRFIDPPRKLTIVSFAA